LFNFCFDEGSNALTARERGLPIEVLRTLIESSFARASSRALRYLQRPSKAEAKSLCGQTLLHRPKEGSKLPIPHRIKESDEI